MSVRKIKKKVLQLLATEDLQVIVLQLAELPVKDVVNALFSAICRGEPLVHWHGVRCMGIFVARLAEQDMEEARIIMRRMLWSLNDESGGIGWGAPEAMAEVMVCSRDLADEYIHMLLSYTREDGEELFQDGNFIEHEALQRGLLWGIGRLAEKRPALLLERGAASDIVPYLDSADSSVRGLALRCLCFLQPEKTAARLRQLAGDTGQVVLYRDDRVQTVTVVQIAEEALGQLDRLKEEI